MSSPGTNTSATGGPMTPQSSPAPLEGSDLLDLFQETLVALSGLDTTLVRPNFQTDPPNIPDAGTAWLSFSIIRRPADVNPVIVHDPLANDGIGDDTLKRQEELHVLLSFYDNGSSGQAYALAAQVRDCFDISQNMWALEQSNIYLGYTGECIPVPSLLKTLWLYRVDLMIVFRRQVDRVFSTLNILFSDTTLHYGGAGDANAAIGEFDIGGSGIGDTQGDQFVEIHVPPPKPLGD